MDVQTAFLMNAEIQLDSGLFKHCRSVSYHWGRGNGFAALGYAETLTYLPDVHSHRDGLISAHKRHLDALIAHQEPSGMFSQLLDLPGTYQELTSVCMVGYAVARGLRLGWLDESYREFRGLSVGGCVRTHRAGWRGCGRLYWHRAQSTTGDSTLTAPPNMAVMIARAISLYGSQSRWSG